MASQKPYNDFDSLRHVRPKPVPPPKEATGQTQTDIDIEEKPLANSEVTLRKYIHEIYHVFYKLTKVKNQFG